MFKSIIAGLAALACGSAALAQTSDQDKFDAFASSPGPETFLAFVEGSWGEINRNGKRPWFDSCDDQLTLTDDQLGLIDASTLAKLKGGTPVDPKIEGVLAFFVSNEGRPAAARATDQRDAIGRAPAALVSYDIKPEDSGLLTLKFSDEPVTYEFYIVRADRIALVHDLEQPLSGPFTTSETRIETYYERCKKDAG